MKWSNCLGEAAGLGSIIILLLIVSVLTASGLITGNYAIVLRSNVFFEHYIEFALLIIGLFFYVKYRKIRFTFHPKRK